MNKQEIFDAVVQHFKAQKEPASDGYGECLYRAEDGNKCAVGILIPDSMYSLKMEGCDVNGLVEKSAEGIFTIPDFIGNHVELLTQLQATHDLAGSTLLNFNTATELKAVAKEFSLDDSEVNWD